MDILPFFKKIVKEHQRDLVANDSVYNAKFNYAINEIKTSRYTWYNFIVLNLFEQFHRVVNIYFVVLLILQYIPQISSLNPTTTLIPIVFVLAITAIKDAVDDFRRHRSDHSVNNRISHILRNGQLVEEKWMNIKVGDIIKLENNNHVTADILLLSSSEEHNLVYIETAELDGETNLKVRQALPNTGDMNDDLRKLSNFKGAVKCETPNNHLHKFTGNLYWGEEAFPLDNEKILLRGCTLRNTEWCFGLVLFAGPDTKLMQNTGKSIMKKTSMEKLMNKLVWLIFAFLLLLAIITAIGNSIWESSTGESFQVYLPWEGFASSAAMSGFLSFWSYIIILNTVVPISLYVSVEFIRLGQSLFINWDQKMYYEKKDLPAVYRTTALNEELGQIEYVFSDKTGTLTQNVMEFNKCTVAGKRYGDVFDEDGNAVYPDEYTSKVDLSYNMYAQEGFQFYDSRLVNAIKNHDENCEEFFRLISICHTVMPDETSDGNLVYQAQSPDEGALVAAARNFGFVFKSRTFDTITIVEMGEAVEYKVLAILDFDNVRKRMSVIVQDPKGKITLYCKGADTVIYERLDAHSDEDMKKITEEHLEAFACDGLRTLCLAKKHLDEDAYNVWKEAHDEANTALEDRDDRLSAVYEEIERDMILLGATAVEDKLQDGVPETIANLAKANIKIWVLTGDKQETAVNIGYSCNMLTDEMKNVFIISGFSSEEVEAKISAAMHEIHASERSNFSTNLHDDDVQFINHTSSEENGQSVSILSGSTDQYGLVINGQSLVYALANDLELKFLELASLCKAVICCRVTPLQKAKVVQLVKCNKKAVTLAIGDGANDVSMIKAAHIGVGISGEEGTQAVLSSDFALGQFRFLERLLLVHGRWSYVRMSKFFGYFFYKNFAFTLVHFWYGFFNGLTAQSAYDDWFVTLYNIAYTSTPIFVLAILDQDLDDDFSVRFPKLYLPGQKNELFNVKIFFVSLFRGILTSLVLFFIPYGAFSTGMASNGMDMTDYHTVSMVISTCLIIVVSLQAALDTSFWTPINHFFIWGSIGIYFVFTFAMHSDGLFQLVPSQFPFVGVSRNAFTHAALWLTLLLVVMICILPVVAIRFAYAVCWPTYAQKILQIQLRERKKEKKMRIKSPDNFANNLKQRFQTKFKIKRRTSRPKSGYAFSHQHGFGDLITSGRMSMRRKNQPPGSDNRTSEIATVSGSPAIESTDQPVMTETYKKINID
ncbi:phospholipid-transporting ATPase ID-like isoform X1 [Clavelina lepadiformis]|uniref:phospholipid-transporting ATPase ID-like isoform X1 n=1 Tax=Clavelina lepadiformis TaxID=159417 RepID=UPI0040412C0E